MDGGEELTYRQRQCIDLRQLHFTNKQIARKLGVSPATVAMHLYIARQKLRASKRKGGGAHSEDHPLAPTADGTQEPVGLTWSDVIARAAAVAMLWLTILGLLALITKPLIDP